MPAGAEGSFLNWDFCGNWVFKSKPGKLNFPWKPSQLTPVWGLPRAWWSRIFPRTVDLPGSSFCSWFCIWHVRADEKRPLLLNPVVCITGLLFLQPPLSPLGPVVPRQAAPHPVSWNAAGEQPSEGTWRPEKWISLTHLWAFKQTVLRGLAACYSAFGIRGFWSMIKAASLAFTQQITFWPRLGCVADLQWIGKYIWIPFWTSNA